jgi:hypothetical protein
LNALGGAVVQLFVSEKWKNTLFAHFGTDGFPAASCTMLPDDFFNRAVSTSWFHGLFNEKKHQMFKNSNL